MAKNSIRDYSATNSSNTDIQSIDISEGCSPAGINNAIREVMADLKDVSTGAVALESPAMDSLTVDTTGIVYSGGNVGIGRSPNYKLDAYLSGTGSPAIASSNDHIVTVVQSVGSTQGNVGTLTSHPLVLLAGNTERMRIDSSGNIGIGGSPSGKFDVQNGALGRTLLQYNGTSYNYFDVDTHVWRSASAADFMRIDSSGNLIVGSTSVNFTERFKVENSASYTMQSKRTGTGAEGHIVFANANGAVGTIFTNGTSTSYNTSSDYRLKENVTADWDATTRLKQLNPVRFNFIADADTTVDGFLAHEVQDVVPEAISGTKDAMRDEEYTVSAATGDIYTPAIEAVLDEDGNEVTPAVAEAIHSTDVERPEELAEGQQWRETTAAVMGTRSVPDYQGIDQSKLVPLLVKTIQELEARITALEAN